MIEIFKFNTYSNNFHALFKFQKLYIQNIIFIYIFLHYIFIIIFIYIYFKINSNNRFMKKRIE